jgi:uncharacterized membrane protein YjfL (UPF0719 family)
MAAISAGVFAALAWGAIALVVLVFAYELYVVALEYRARADESQ